MHKLPRTNEVPEVKILISRTTQFCSCWKGSPIRKFGLINEASEDSISLVECGDLFGSLGHKVGNTTEKIMFEFVLCDYYLGNLAWIISSWKFWYGWRDWNSAFVFGSYNLFKATDYIGKKQKINHELYDMIFPYS